MTAWDIDNEAVEVVPYLDLAREPAGVLNIESEVEHVLFHGRRPARYPIPFLFHIDMARRAGTCPAALRHDAAHLQAVE